MGLGSEATRAVGACAMQCSICAAPCCAPDGTMPELAAASTQYLLRGSSGGQRRLLVFCLGPLLLQVPLEELDLRRLREAAEEMREQLGVTSKAVSVLCRAQSMRDRASMQLTAQRSPAMLRPRQ